MGPPTIPLPMSGFEARQATWQIPTSLRCSKRGDLEIPKRKKVFEEIMGK